MLELGDTNSIEGSIDILVRLCFYWLIHQHNFVFPIRKQHNVKMRQLASV